MQESEKQQQANEEPEPELISAGTVEEALQQR